MAGVKGRSGGARANSGGKRAGAGRKPSPKVLLTATPAPQTDDADKAPVIEIPQDGEPASLAFLRSVMHHPDLDVRIRMEAAKTLAPYEATRKGDVGKRKDAADAAKKAGTGKFAPSLPPRTASVLPFPPQDSTDRE